MPVSMLRVANLVNKLQATILFYIQVKVRQYEFRRDECYFNSSQTTDERGNFLLFRCDC